MNRVVSLRISDHRAAVASSSLAALSSAVRYVLEVRPRLARVSCSRFNRSQASLESVEATFGGVREEANGRSWAKRESVGEDRQPIMR